MTKEEQEMLDSGEYIQCPKCSKIIRADGKKCGFCGNYIINYKISDTRASSMITVDNNEKIVTSKEDNLASTKEMIDTGNGEIFVSTKIKENSSYVSEMSSARPLCYLIGFIVLLYDVYSFFNNDILLNISVFVGSFILLFLLMGINTFFGKNEQAIKSNSKNFFKDNLPYALELAKLSTDTKYSNYIFDRNSCKILTLYHSSRKMASIMDKGKAKITVFPSHVIKSVSVVDKSYDAVVKDEEKSVVKRAVVGGVLAGGVGAVVGAASGLKQKEPDKIVHVAGDIYVEVTLASSEYPTLKIYTNNKPDAVNKKRQIERFFCT